MDVFEEIYKKKEFDDQGIDYEFNITDGVMKVMVKDPEPTLLEGIGEGLERVAGTTASIGAGAVGATLGLPTDLASLFVSIGKSVGAEDGKKLETFANTFETLSKENYGSQFYKGLFDNFVDDLNISDQKKEDFKAGFVGGEFLGVGNVGREAAKKAPAVAKSIRETSEEVGEAAQKRVDENQGSMTMSSMGVGEMGNMVNKSLSKLAPNKGEVINLKPKVDRLNFYSKAEEVTNQLKQNKGTGQQYRQQLLKAGVKPDEIQWLGLDDVLNKGKITKQELQDQINANRIELDEVELKGDKTKPGRMGDNFQSLRGRFVGGQKDDYTVDEKGTTVYTFVDPETKYIITGNNDQGYEIFRSEADMKEGKNYLQRNFGRGRQNIGSFDEALIQTEQIMVEEGLIDSPKNTPFFREFTESGGDNYREFLVRYDNPKVQFDEDHFNIPGKGNVIAHFRTKDRITFNDKKVFYIEEIQSDWGQQARQRGLKPSEEELAQLKTAEQNLINKLEDSYKNVFVPKRIQNLLKENNLILNENVKYSLKSDEKLIPYNEFINNINKELEPKDPVIEKFEFLKMLRKGSLVFDGDKRYLPKRENKDGFLRITLPQTEQNVLVEQILKNRKNQFSGISKAPFITDTDKWTQLTLKRILSRAVDEGYDFVSITSGKAQMDRWKDEGVAKFYDEIVPKNAEKIVKKLDKNAIQKQRIAIPFNDVTADEFLAGSDFKERFSIELTPQLKEKVKKGMAMFSATPLVVGQENE
jgi:hypothetical protein